MNNLSCNVVKDLLPSYVDNICSDESRTLVDEHLMGCPNCRDFMKNMSTDYEKSNDNSKKEFDYMKKIRRSMEMKSLCCMLFIVVSSIILSYCSVRYLNNPITFNILLPIILLCNYFMFSDSSNKIHIRKGISVKCKLIIIGLQVICTCTMLLFMNVLIPSWIDPTATNVALPFGLELYEIGPIIWRIFTTIMLVTIIIWGVLIHLHMKGYQYNIVISSFSIVVVYAIILCQYILKRLDNIETYDQLCNKVLILMLEGILIIGGLFLVNYYLIDKKNSRKKFS